jgi:hypothetical protein
MTTQMLVIAVVLCTAPSLVIVFGAAALRSQKYQLELRVWFILALFTVGTVAIPFVWCRNVYAGFFYALISYAVPVLAAAVLLGKWQFKKERLANVVLVTYTLSFGLAIPFAVLPFFQRQTSNPVEPRRGPIDAAFIRHSAEQIQGSMNGAVRDIQREQNRVEFATKQLIDQVDRQIRDLQKERAALKIQVDYQRALAALTKPQADAVRDSLARGKYFDYLIGFLIGIASSATVTVGSRWLGKL